MKKDAEQVGIWGCKGSGKTTRQKEMIEGRKRVIVLDPMDNFGGKGYRRVTSIPAMRAAIQAGWYNGFHLVIPTGHHEAQCLVFMRKLVPVLFLVQKPYYEGKRFMVGHEITLVIDEAHKFFPNRTMTPEQQEPLEDIIALGRHYGIEMLAASQRTANVWTDYRGNCDKQYFFAQGDHTDIASALKSIGTEHRAALMDLRAHEYLLKSRSAGSKVVKGRNIAKFR